MTLSPQIRDKIRDFATELSRFASTAEATLKLIEDNPLGKKAEFVVFSDRMFTIRGSAQQLGLPHIAKIAGLGEEISLKAADATSRSQVRKCIGSLWDALTTVKYLLEHIDQETIEEQNILENRLQATLKALGGARPTMSEDEIAALLAKRL